ncbi:MAG: gliding motility-associated-like protein, partial [Saprospiraceae bacterium]
DITLDAGLIVTGRSNTANGTGNVTVNNGSTDFWLIKLSASGNLEWENNFGGSARDVPYSVLQTEDEGYIIAGYSESSDIDVEENNGDWDYWVLKIKPREFELDLGNDTTLCSNEVLLLNANMEAGNTFKWQDGSTDSTFLVTTEGWSQVDVMIGDCMLEDSLFVNYIDNEITDLGPDTSFCFSENEPFLLVVSVENANSYFWQNGSTDSTLLVQQSGRYWVDVEISGCISSDTVDLSFNNPQVDMGKDTFKCENESLTLNAFYPGADYLWSDGSSERKLILGDTGTYWVIVDLNGCLESDTIHVGLCEIVHDPCLEFPNVFSPNGDGINDIFRPVSFCRLESYQLSVFNRWGEQLFVSTNAEDGWDGFYNKKKPIQGVYVYVAEYSYKLDGILYKNIVKGVVSLIR